MCCLPYRIWNVHAACASAELSGTFEYPDRDASGGELDRRRHARVAAADDGDCCRWFCAVTFPRACGRGWQVQFFSHVLKANHSLYPPPKETRSLSTWQPLATTSSSVAR